jgi:transposase, IS30 family
MQRTGARPAAVARPKPGKLAIDTELRTMVQELLDRRWSPEQISQQLRRIFPDQPQPETITR